ncbi:hypothetical protein RYX36_028251, partial [Vicia faba]
MDIEEEKKVLDVGVSEESAGRCIELKNLEGDDVFEEAIDPVKHLSDQVDDIVGEGDVAVTVSALPLVLVDEIHDNVDELDNFQDAIEVVEILKGEKEVEVVANQDVLEDPGLESSSGKEIADLSNGGSMVFQEAGDLVNGNSGLLGGKDENEDLEFMTPKQNGGMLFGNRSIDKIHTESGSDEDIRNQGADAGLDPNLRDDKIEEQCNASRERYGEIQNDLYENASRHSSHGDLEPNKEMNDETIGTDISHGGLEPNGEIFIDMDDETIGTDISHGVTNGKEMGISDIQKTECKDYGNDETKDDDAGSSLEHLETIGETGGFSPVVDERKVIETVGSSSLLENSFATEMPAVQTTATNSEEESMDVYRSKVSKEESQGNNENLSVVGEPKKILENKPKEKQTTQITKEQNSEFVSSSGKSVATSTPLVHPAGLGSGAPLLKPAPRVVHQSRANYTVSNTQSQKMEDSSTVEAGEYDETREKLQMIRVKFLRLANRFGQTPHNVVVAQVLYRLGLAEQLRGRNGGRVGAFSFDRASAMAEQLESAGQEPLDFSCTIMIIGKTGVGKSATINSIFDEVKFNTDAFNMGTKKVQDVV